MLELSESLEDYLETIAFLSRKNGEVRVSDVATVLDVKKSSVSAGVNRLKDLELVTQQRYGDIELTPTGLKRAKDIQRRHDLLESFMVDILGIDIETASHDACKMEHAISKKSFDTLAKFIDHLKSCGCDHIEKFKK